jgi:uncharacterized protein
VANRTHITRNGCLFVAVAESVKESQYADARERKVKLSWAPGKVIGGEDYLLQMTIPNTFFHIAMAYAILRHNGVDVGKMHFLGSRRTCSQD